MGGQFTFYCDKIKAETYRPCEGCDRNCPHLTKCSKGRAMSLRLREKIFAKYDKCLKCGSTEDLTVDHIRAIKKGGTNTEDNLQVLCGECNVKKDDRFADYRDPEFAIELLKRMLKPKHYEGLPTPYVCTQKKSGVCVTFFEKSYEKTASIPAYFKLSPEEELNIIKKVGEWVKSHYPNLY